MRRPGGASRRSSPPSPPTPNAARWSSRLRADRLGELSAHPDFARLVEPGLHLLSAMSDADLRAAIEGPARQVGLLLEPGLVDLLVREVEGEPGALPLLSHALHETWQRREGRTLTVDGLPGHRWDPRRGRPVGRGGLRPGTRRRSGRCCATCCCAW